MNESQWFPKAPSPIIVVNGGPKPIKQQRSLALVILELMESAVAPSMAGADHSAKREAVEQALAEAKAAINNGRLDLAMAAAWNCCVALTEFQIRNHYNSGTELGEITGKFKARAPQRKGGGKKEGSGRKKAVADDDVLCAAYDDAKRENKSMKIREVRKKAVKMLKSDGHHANKTAIAEAVARRRKRVGNR